MPTTAFWVILHLIKKQKKKYNLVPLNTIILTMIGHTIAIHKGKEDLTIYITDPMVGHKLGEFSPTFNFRGHAKNDNRSRR